MLRNWKMHETMLGFLVIVISVLLLQFGAASNSKAEVLPSDEPLTIETISIGEKDIYRPGETAVVTAEPNKAVSNATYNFRLYKDNVLCSTTTQSFNQLTVTFDDEGTYKLRVRVIDESGERSVFKQSDIVDVIADYPLTPEIFDFRMESGTAIQRGESVKYSFKVRGGSGKFEDYNYWYIVDNVNYEDENDADDEEEDHGNYFGWQNAYEFFANSGTMSVSCYLRFVSEGEYSVSFSCMDVDGKTKGAFVSLPQITVEEKPITIKNITCDHDRAIAGEPITWNVETSDTTAQLIYCYQLYRYGDTYGASDDPHYKLLDQQISIEPTYSYTLKERLEAEGLELRVSAHVPETGKVTNTYKCRIRNDYFYEYDVEVDEELWDQYEHMVSLYCATAKESYSVGDTISWLAVSVNENWDDSIGEYVITGYVPINVPAMQFNFVLTDVDGDLVAESGWQNSVEYSYTFQEGGWYLMTLKARDRYSGREMVLIGELGDSARYYISSSELQYNPDIWTFVVGDFLHTTDEVRFVIYATENDSDDDVCEFYVYKDGELVWNRPGKLTTDIFNNERCYQLIYRIEDYGRYEARACITRADCTTIWHISDEPCSFSPPVMNTLLVTDYMRDWYGDYSSEFDSNPVFHSAGESVRLTANATGGIGELEYEFNISLDGEPYSFGTFTEATTPGLVDRNEMAIMLRQPGTYKASVRAKDAFGTWTETVWSSEFYATDWQNTVLQISGVYRGARACRVGDESIWNVVSTGGIGQREFQFVLYRDGEKYSVFDWQKSNYKKVKFNAPGTYYMMVAARDESGAQTDFVSSGLVYVSDESEAEEEFPDEGIIVLPMSMTEIESKSFVGIGSEYIEIPATVEAIAADAFDPEAKLIVIANSFADKWAKEHGFMTLYR